MNRKAIAWIFAIIGIIAVGVGLALFLVKPKQYTVSFNTVGGTPITSQKVKENKFAVRPNNPVRSGYEFADWYLNDQIFDFATPITEDIVLTAKWTAKAGGNEPNEPEKAKYIVSFSSDGGSGVASQTVEEGQTAIEPVAPVRNGYTFLGWYLNNVKFNFTTTAINENITLTAKWQKNNTSNSNPETPSKPEPEEPSEPEKPSDIKVTGISLSATTLKLARGQKNTLVATVKPNNATNKNVTWTTSDKNIATVDSKGNVTAIKKGEVTITATAGGKSATAKIKVYDVAWKKDPESSLDEYKLFIECTDGDYASGIVAVTKVSGKTTDVEVTPSGVLYIKSVVSNAKIKEIK